MSTLTIGDAVNATLIEVRARLGKLFDEVEADRSVSVTAQRKQIWSCLCGQDRVYGLDVPWDVLEKSDKMLNCQNCQVVTVHSFRCVSRTDL